MSRLGWFGILILLVLGPAKTTAQEPQSATPSNDQSVFDAPAAWYRAYHGRIRAGTAAIAARRLAWITAYQDQQYQRLAAALNAHVFEALQEADPIALHLLGQMHAAGLGVPRDRPLA